MFSSGVIPRNLIFDWARLGEVWWGKAGYGELGSGSAGQGAVGRGTVGSGVARQGLVGCGMVWQGQWVGQRAAFPSAFDAVRHGLVR